MSLTSAPAPALHRHGQLARRLSAALDSPWLTAAAITAVGVVGAGVSFGLAGGNPTADGTHTLPALWPPDFVFWAVWLVIYPASGVALSLVWRRRRDADVRGAVAAFGLMNVANLLFLPVSGLVGGLPSVLTIMDLNGVVSVYVLAWLFSRYEPRAALWMLPYLIWMPLTSALKAWYWVLN